MAVLILQSMLDYTFQVSATRRPVAKLWAQLATGGGPHWPVAVAAKGDARLKADVLAHLDRWRVRPAGPGARKRAHDTIAATPEACAWLRGKAVRALGFKLHVRPRDPLKQDAREWLEVVALVGGANPRGAGAAARYALEQDTRLNTLVRRGRAVDGGTRKGGGWDLSEALGGFCARDRQQELRFFEELSPVVEHGWHVHRIRDRASGAVFYFPVFAEWYEREHKRPPAGAIRAGVRIHKPKERTGTRPRRPHVPVAVCTEQAPLPW